jgi:hypothetical protein
VDSTIGLIEPVKDKAQAITQQVKEQSVETGNRALDRMGTMAMWLAGLAIITLGVTIAGGWVGTPESSSMEVRAAHYREHAA